MTPKQHAENTIRLLEERKRKKKDKTEKMLNSFKIEQCLKSRKKNNSTKGKGWRKSFE